MANLNDQFLDKENFYIAFKKVSTFFRQHNEWYDPILLTEYEALLPGKIEHLISQLKNETYTPHPVNPLPFPKKNKSNRETCIRPYYNIHLDDQLIWMAITNIISDFIEDGMPEWSYGNRLYKPVWYEKDKMSEKIELKKGKCRNTSGNVYRKWGQSWPLFRRHIALTVKTMAKNNIFKEDDIDDDKELKVYKSEEQRKFRDTRYLDKAFWSTKHGKLDKLYWASLDFETFFPSIDAKWILNNIRSSLSGRNDTSKILSTVEKMLRFPIEHPGWQKRELKTKSGFNLENTDFLEGIPTGLVVGGFLANTALSELDKKINQYITSSREVALFKYVDDQVLLAQTKNALYDFLNFYQKTINEFASFLKFQASKIEPEAVLFENKKFRPKQKTGNSDLIDVAFPSPLMTNTLRKLSHINSIDFELLDNSEMKGLEVDLTHFLLTDFPPTEIKKDTKMSFAAGKLCRLAIEKKPDFFKIDPLFERNVDNVNNICARLMEMDPTGDNEKKKKDKKAKNREAAAKEFAQKQMKEEIAIVRKWHQSIFNLLLKALRDNPDKVKLWRRCVEFCYYTGHSGLKEIMEIIEECDIHNKSKDYVFSRL